MDKEQAVDFIIRQYTIGRAPADITQELSRQLGAPAAVVEKFVTTTIEKSFPSTKPVVSAPASFPPPPRPAPGAWQASDVNAIPSFAPDTLPEDDDEIYDAPPPPAVTLNNITGPEYVVGDERQVASAAMFLTGRTLEEAAIPDPTPVDVPVSTSPEELQRLESDPELTALILKLAGRNTKQSDIVMTVCERHNLDWKDAQRLTARIMSKNRKTISSKQNALMLPFSIVMLLAGGALIFASLMEFLRLRDLLVSQSAMANIALINQTDYMIRYVVPFAVMGLAFLAGGLFGLIKAIQTRTE
jgi:hypothetical protein